MGPLTNIGPIKDTNHLFVENNLDKAELFNNVFHSVYILVTMIMHPLLIIEQMLLCPHLLSLEQMLKKLSLNLRTLLHVVLMGAPIIIEKIS